MPLKLYGSNIFRGVKLVVAAQYAGVELEIVEYNPHKATEQEKAEYLKKNPNGLVPVLETPEGFIYESNAILRYLARHNNVKLYGNTTYEHALVDQYLDWIALTLEPAMYKYIVPFLGHAKVEKAAHDEALETLKKALRILDDRLKQSKYLAGETLTIADIQAVAVVGMLFRYCFDEKARKPFHNLVKYFEQVSNEENFKKAVGRPHLCKTSLPVFSA